MPADHDVVNVRVAMRTLAYSIEFDFEYVHTKPLPHHRTRDQRNAVGERPGRRIRSEDKSNVQRCGTIANEKERIRIRTVDPMRVRVQERSPLLACSFCIHLTVCIIKPSTFALPRLFAFAFVRRDALRRESSRVFISEGTRVGIHRWDAEHRDRETGAGDGSTMRERTRCQVHSRCSLFSPQARRLSLRCSQATTETLISDVSPSSSFGRRRSADTATAVSAVSLPILDSSSSCADAHNSPPYLRCIVCWRWNAHSPS